MNNKLKFILISLLVIVIAVVMVWKFVINKPTKDFAGSKPEMSYSFTGLMKKIETDTSNLRNKLIAVNGSITKIAKDSNSIRLEIGSDTIMSSVTCDIDARYVKDMSAIKEGDQIDIKGIVSEVTVDPESSFGNTVALIYCSLNKK